MKFRRLEAYAELDFQCFQLGRNTSDKNFDSGHSTWHTRAIEMQEVKGYLISEWWMPHKYRRMVNFPHLCSKWWGFNSNINGWAGFHYKSSVLSHIFWQFILCLQEHIWLMHLFPPCFGVFMSVCFVTVYMCRAQCAMRAMQSFSKSWYR